MTFDLEMARDLAANPIHCPETDEVFRKAMAEIERLKSELESLNIELMAAGEIVMAKDVQIKELEDALVNERAWRICHIPQDRVGHWPRYEPMLQDEARQQLQAEGKIGPDASKPRSWQITDERKEAIQAMSAMHINVDCPECGAWLYFSDIADYRNVLRAMLEAGQ